MAVPSAAVLSEAVGGLDGRNEVGRKRKVDPVLSVSKGTRNAREHPGCFQTAWRLALAVPCKSGASMLPVKGTAVGRVCR